MRLRKRNLAAPVALATLALVGCGSGSDNNSQANSQPVKAGETQNSRIIVDGNEIQKTVYRVYSVADDQGSLSDVPLPNGTDEANRPHVLIAESHSQANVAPAAAAASAVRSAAYAAPAASTFIPTTVAEYKICYQEFWKGMQKHYPTKDKAFIAKRLNDFNMTIDDLCIKQASSKLTMDEYIEMFQVVLKYWPNDPQIEGKVARFFMNMNVTPGTFKQTLVSLNYTWEDFARRLSNDKKGVTSFANDYELSDLALEPFLRNYMAQQQPGPVIAMIQNKIQVITSAMAETLSPRLLMAAKPNLHLAQASSVTPYTDGAKAIVDAAEKIWDLGKKIWTFIDPGKPELDAEKLAATGASMSNKIVAASVPEPGSYEYAKSSQSKTVTFLGDSWRGVAYKVDMVLNADYAATNPNVGGQWVPNFGVVVKSAQIERGYSVKGDAKVSNVVNRGSLADPVPEAQIDLTLTATNWTVNQQTFSVLVNGVTGASVKN